MPKKLDPGTKIEYFDQGKWLQGTIHGVQTHETNLGIVTKIMYLIDTGKTVREDIGAEPTGKKVKHPITGELIPEMKEVKVRQPEQVQLDQQFVRLVPTDMSNQ